MKKSNTFYPFSSLPSFFTPNLQGLIDEALDLSQKVLMLGCADLLSSPSSYIEKQ
jgi:hypothetical protein